MRSRFTPNFAGYGLGYLCILHLLDITQANMNAAFDFARELTHVKSLPEFFELSTAHVRKQVETLTKRTQDLTQLATQAAQPLQTIGKTFNQSS
jgi:hypothetical protein